MFCRSTVKQKMFKCQKQCWNRFDFDKYEDTQVANAASCKTFVTH